MANYEADLMTYKVPFRGAFAGQEFQVTGVVKIPVGTKLTDGDTIKFARLGQGVSVVGVRISTDGDLDDGTAALAGSLGFFRAYAPDGTTVLTVDDKTGTTYTSPADSTAYLVADAANALRDVLRAPGVATFVAGQSGLDNELANFDADGLAGPADVGIEITATADGDAGATTYIRCTLTCIQKEATPGEFSGKLAEAYKNRYTGSSSGGLVS